MQSPGSSLEQYGTSLHTAGMKNTQTHSFMSFNLLNHKTIFLDAKSDFLLVNKECGMYL